MDTNDLLFAAEVRKLAVQLKKAEHSEESNKQDDLPRLEYEAIMAEFDRKHPVKDYIAKAYQELVITAIHIESLKSA